MLDCIRLIRISFTQNGSARYHFSSFSCEDKQFSKINWFKQNEFESVLSFRLKQCSFIVKKVKHIN